MLFYAFLACFLFTGRNEYALDISTDPYAKLVFMKKANAKSNLHNYHFGFINLNLWFYFACILRYVLFFAGVVAFLFYAVSCSIMLIESMDKGWQGNTKRRFCKNIYGNSDEQKNPLGMHSCFNTLCFFGHGKILFQIGRYVCRNVYFWVYHIKIMLLLHSMQHIRCFAIKYCYLI